MANQLTSVTARLDMDKRNFDRKMKNAERGLMRLRSSLSMLGLSALPVTVAFGLMARNAINVVRGLSELDRPLTNAEAKAAEFGRTFSTVARDVSSIGRDITIWIAGGLLEASRYAGWLTTGLADTVTRGSFGFQRGFNERVRASQELAQAERDLQQTREASQRTQEMLLRTEQERSNLSRQIIDNAISRMSIETQIALAQDQYNLELRKSADLSQTLETRKQAEVDATRLKLKLNQLIFQQEDIAERQRQDDIENRKRAEEELAEMRNRVMEIQRQARFEELDLDRQIEETLHRIARLEGEANTETMEGLHAKESLIREQQLLNRLTDESVRIEQRKTAEMESQLNLIADIRRQIEGINQSADDEISQRGQIGIEDLASGERGTGRQQRSARRVQREQANQQRLYDLYLRARERGDLRNQERYHNRIRQSLADEREASREIGDSLRESDRHPHDRARSQLRALNEQLSVQRDMLQTLREI